MRRLEEISQHQRAACRQVVITLHHQDSIKNRRTAEDELHTLVLELGTIVLLS
jgi:hypothetical protein